MTHPHLSLVFLSLAGGIALGGIHAIATADVAHADVLPPEAAACSGKALGGGCAKSSAGTIDGTCVNGTCSGIDYYADGGRGTRSYICLECTGPAASATTSPSGSTSGTPVAAHSGCAVGPLVGLQGAARLIGPFAIAIAVPLLCRRRRNKR